MIFRNRFAPFVNITPDESYSERNRAWQGAPSVALSGGVTADTVRARVVSKAGINTLVNRFTL